MKLLSQFPTKLQFWTMILFTASILISPQAQSQCNWADTAVASNDTLFCQGGTQDKSSVAYNPTFQLYYSNNSGGLEENEYFDINGTRLGGNNSVDWRGLWFNTSLNLLEGNAWNNNFRIDSLQAGGFLGGGLSLPFSTSPPDVQSIGCLNYDDSLICYYQNGVIYRESRVDGTDSTNLVLSGMTNGFGNISSRTVIYTGCAGKELGLYDYVNNVMYFFDKNTGALADSVALPADAPQSAVSTAAFSYANDQLWIFDIPSNNWIGYHLVAPTSSVNKLDNVKKLEVFPNPTNTSIMISNVRENWAVVELYSPMGQLLHSQSLRNPQVDLSNYSAGLYILLIKDEAGDLVARSKVIKQ